jgi:hypothetical protein
MAVRPGPRVFSFLKSFFVFLSRFFLPPVLSGPQGAASSFVPAGPGSPAPIRAARHSPSARAHDVLPDLGKPLGRNAPHLTDDAKGGTRCSAGQRSTLRPH